MILDWTLYDHESLKVQDNAILLQDLIPVNDSLRLAYPTSIDEVSSEYMILNQNDEEVGQILLYSDSETTVVDLIKIYESYRRHHIATDVIKSLLETTDILGTARAASIDFWNSLRADIPSYHKLEDPDYLIPFKLTRLK